MKAVDTFIERIMTTVARASIVMMEFLKIGLIAFLLISPRLPWLSQILFAYAFFGALMLAGIIIGLHSKFNI